MSPSTKKNIVLSKLDEKKFLRRTRATWLAEKLDVNFARANAIMENLVPPTPAQNKKISRAIKEETRAPLHMRRKP